MTAQVKVRTAETRDAVALADIHLQAWRETYAAVLPEVVFARRDAERDERVQIWEEIIRGGSRYGKERVWVGELDGVVVGWATASDGRDDGSPYELELDGLYVLARAHGTGVGQALLEAAVGVELGAYVWTWKAPTRAGAFYRRNGFIADGVEREFTTDGAHLIERRLVRHPHQ